MNSTPIGKYLFGRFAEGSRASTPKVQRGSNLLAYSPLDDQVMPPSVDSSPDIELQHKKLFSGGITPNITLLNDYRSEDESDESFLRMENLIRGPHKSSIKNQDSSPATLKNSSVDNRNDVADSKDMSSASEDRIDAIEKNAVLHRSFNKEPPVSNAKLIESLDGMKQKSSVLEDSFDTAEENVDIHRSSNKQSSISNVKLVDGFDDSKDFKYEISHLNSLIDSLDTSKEKLKHPSVRLSLDMSQDIKKNVAELNKSSTYFLGLKNRSLTDHEKDFEESLKFNDTIEEMDYFLKHGASKLLAESKKITGQVNRVNKPDKISTICNLKYLNKNINAITPIKTNNFLTPLSVEKKQPTSIPKLTPFKVPMKNNLTPKSGTPKLMKQNSGTKLNYPVSKHENIMSPIRYYIKNSPTVPLVKNISPAKNYWDRVPREPTERLSKAKKHLNKENIHLPEKAYKSPKVTKMIERPTPGRLPHNNKVSAMADNLPKVMVIKHVKREKVTALPQSNMDFKDRKSVKEVEDSFAHLSVDSVDVSHCVGKPVVRCKTLK